MAQPGDITKRGMNLLADVSVGGAGARIGARHFSVTNGGEQHGHHGDENGGDDVSAGSIAYHAVDAHGRNRLDDNDANDNQVPKEKSALQFGCGRTCFSSHSVVTDFTRFLG